jgi:hypothetical protein
MHLVAHHFVLIVMSIIFVIQLTLVSTLNLDRWIGMGMGMFSGISERWLESAEVQVNGVWVDVTASLGGQWPHPITDRFTQFPNQYTERWLLHAARRADLVPATATAIRVRVSVVAAYHPGTGEVQKRYIYVSR